MPSKKSFFNSALFRKNLLRYWPMWGGLSLAGALIPLYLLLELWSVNRKFSVVDFRGILYEAVTTFAPAFTAVYAILCAMAVWNYLNQARAVGMMHTLPIDRTCLFVTNTLSGLTMIAIPYMVVGGLICLIALFLGALDPAAVLVTILSVIFLAFIFFGLATLCAMLTGHNAVLPVLYLLFNFIAPMLESVLTYLAEEFLFGFNIGYGGVLNFLSPATQLYYSFTVHYTDGMPEIQGGSILILALYGLAGVILLVLSWLLYRRRKSESAGDVVAFKWLRPVFRYGIALASAVLLGTVLYQMTWGVLTWSHYIDKVPMVISMMIAGVVGYYVASMLLEKTLRVFRGSAKGVIGLCIGIAVLSGIVSLDPLGIESYVPEVGDIEWVLLDAHSEGLQFDEAEYKPVIEEITEIHRAILNDEAYIRGFRNRINPAAISEEDVSSYINLYLSYHLRDQSVVKRTYRLPITKLRMQNPDTYDGMIRELYSTPLVQLASVQIPDNASLQGVYAIVEGTESELPQGKEAEEVYAAVIQDAKEGNMPFHKYPFAWLDEGLVEYPARLQIEYLIKTSNPDRNTNASYSANVNTYRVELYSTMEHTIQKLIDLGTITREQILAWESMDEN